MEVHSFDDLQKVLCSYPNGTECDVLASDLKTGDFGSAHFWLPDGSEQTIVYTGPVVYPVMDDL